MTNDNQFENDKNLRQKDVKLHATDLLSTDCVDLAALEIYEIRFKNDRKDYFKNVNKLLLEIGDIVAVEANSGHDIGIITLKSSAVNLQLKKRIPTLKRGRYKIIYRKSRQSDFEKWKLAIEREYDTILKTRKIIEKLGLNMKISDVEFQGDLTKATFYYISDERVDFRKLIHILADTFKVRIEMKQIGARQEASKIGGIGSCGRAICCSTFKSSFDSISTNSVRYQGLPLNPEKITGQCNKLKCCLNYEIDAYIDAQVDFPNNIKPLYTQSSIYDYIKSDIFRGIYWYVSRDSNRSDIVALSVYRVQEIIKMNERSEKPLSLICEEEKTEKKTEPSFENNVGKDDVKRFISRKKDKDRLRNKRKNSNETKK